MNKSFAIIITMFCMNAIVAQTKNISYPEVGKPCADFVLQNIKYYPKTQASLKDFRGKWLILDFWNKECGACIASFPKTNALQKQFSEKVQFMLVGIQDKANKIQPMYAKFRERQSLIMPCAFDSMLANRFDIYACPQIFIIDDKGVFRGWVNSVSSENIDDLLSGKLLYLSKPTTIPYDGNKPFLVNGNGAEDTDFLFRSVLTQWKLNHDVSVPVGIEEEAINSGRFEILGVPLNWLYNYAYFGKGNPSGGVNDTTYGKYFRTPVLDVKDSSVFKYSVKLAKNIFSYSLMMPPGISSKSRLLETMQRDLYNYFRYSARIENRMCPYWRLVATDEAKGKLKTKTGKRSFDGTGSTGFTATNFPIKNLTSMIANANHDEIVLDETGINANIDITMDCIMTDLSDVKNALHANGLDLIRGEKEMKVVVISDRSFQ